VTLQNVTAALVLGAALVGCPMTSDEPSPPSDLLRVSTTPRSMAEHGTPKAGPPIKTLSAPGPMADLEVPGHGSAVVSLPLGATSPRPVLVATHGNFDKPEWTCNMWRSVVENRGFVVCPRGMKHPGSPPGDPHHRYASNAALEREIHAALDALKVRYSDFVAPGPVVYAGFSQGAIMGAPIISRNPSLFTRAVLIEGGYDRMSPGVVRSFAKGGGERVLFACGQALCERLAGESARALGKLGVEARVVHGKGEGHSYFGKVADEVRLAFDWVVGLDARWIDPSVRGGHIGGVAASP
jgi:predicted esterase